MESLTRLLPPHHSGLFAALEGAPTADLVLVDAQLRGVMNALELCMYARGLAPAAPDEIALVGDVSERDRALFASFGVLNMLWSFLFFTLKHPDWALIEWGFLWLSVLSLVLGLWRTSRVAAGLNLPYLAWVSTAGLLNWQVIVLNPN